MYECATASSSQMLKCFFINIRLLYGVYIKSPLILLELNCTSREKKKSKRNEKDKRGNTVKYAVLYRKEKRDRKSTELQGILTPSITIIFVLFCGIIEKKKEQKNGVSLSIFYGNRFFIRLNLPQ